MNNDKRIRELSYTLALVHVMDGDELGRIAKELLDFLEDKPISMVLKDEPIN